MEFVIAGAIIAAVIAIVVVNTRVQGQKRRKRRESLYQDSNGTWVWINFDGSPGASSRHPEKKDGDWYEADRASADNSSDFDGGGDGGGGGGD